jgi:hypothetical protein
LSLHGGPFSGGSDSPEFGNFDGSVFGLFTAGRDFAEQFDATEAIFALHWVVRDPDQKNAFTRPHEQVASINFRYEKDRWGWCGDLSRSLGSFDQSDLSGGGADALPESQRAMAGRGEGDFP